MKFLYSMNDVNMIVYVQKGTELVTAIHQGRDHDYQVKKDETGPYFLVKKRKIYLKELTPFTLDDLKKKLKNRCLITQVELMQAIELAGIENINLTYPGKNHPCRLMRNTENNNHEEEFILIHEYKNYNNEIVRERVGSSSSYTLAFLLQSGVTKII